MNDLALAFTTDERGATRVTLNQGERFVSGLWIIPFTLRIGAALVRMDGIGGVATQDEFRNRGYSRRVLEASIERMTAGDAALTMLYGIRNFYPKFGYATAGPDHYLHLTELDHVPEMPAGWTSRPLAPGDVPAVLDLYDSAIRTEVGAALRPEGSRRWQRLTAIGGPDSKDTAIVVTDPAGRLRGYAWRAAGHWYTGIVDRRWPEALVLSEAFADSPPAADALLAACRRWAAQEAEERKVTEIVLSMPPGGMVAAAAMRQATRRVDDYVPCGGSMARVLDVRRLLTALAPELELRLRSSGLSLHDGLSLTTQLGGAVLRDSRDGIRVSEEGREAAHSVQLPQAELARLALGAFPPADVLSRLPEPPAGAAAELLQALFPLRHPHMHLPDRF